jgi:ribosomal protein S18 acetylase RimI-like enzyme
VKPSAAAGSETAEVAAAPAVSMRPAREDDVPFLVALREQTMGEHFRATGVEVTPEQHLARVRVRFECAQIIEHEGRAAGLLEVARDGRDWHLIQIQLAPQLQGRGVGEALISGLIAEARGAGAALSLHVLHTNPARRLYERLGFRIVQDTEHEYLMRWKAGRATVRG